jgi:opacity protein-like surface antigen
MKANHVSLVCLLLILPTNSSNCQTDKGNFLIGGQASFSFLCYNSSWKTDNGSGLIAKQRNFQFTPQLGYFISKNLLVDIMIPITFEKKIEDYYNNKSSIIEFMPVVQKYFGNSRLKPFVFGGIGWGLGHTSLYEHTGVPFTYKTRFKIFTWQAGGGAAFFLTKVVSIDLSIGYFNHTKEVTSATPPSPGSDEKLIDKGFGSDIGLYLYF